MRVSADFRKMARDALRGKWMIAVLVGIVASLLGAGGNLGSEINFNYEGNGPVASWDFAGQTVVSTDDFLNSGWAGFLFGAVIYILILALVVGILLFILGSIIEVGCAKFNLNLMDNQEASFGNLFEYFPHWNTTVAARFLKTLYIVLWALLFIIPGIIASYSYSMTGYILAEHPELSASEALSRSKDMMNGHRFRLFCLEWSFIGWDILCIFTLGIGYLWLSPYKSAAFAAFYREVSGTEYKTYEHTQDTPWNETYPG